VTPLRGRALAVYVFCCAVWGSTWLVIKVGLRDLPPFSFAAIRMGLACAVMAPLAFRHAGRRPTRSEMLWIGVCGLLQIGLSYAFIFFAEQRIDSALAAILFCTFPIWVGLFGHFWLPNEPLTARALAASALGLLGVGVIQGPAVSAALDARPGALLVGGLCVLGSAISSALANVLNKRHFGGVSPSQNVWGQTLVGSTFLAVLAVLFERGAPMRWTPTSVGALLYLTIFGTVLTFVGLFWLIPRVPVAVIGTIPLVDTVVAVLLGALILGETLSSRVFVGAVLILGGVVLVALPGRAQHAGSIAPGGR
jgi:drug/metabolite transporter (DMT)-like permease